MITVGYIGKFNEIDYFYHIVGDKITVQQYSGAEGILKHRLEKLRASSILGLYEDFISIDHKLIDSGKNVHTYVEKVKSMKNYIQWGHENFDVAPGSVIDNGLIMTKCMISMFNMISEEHPSRKELIFLSDCVTSTAKAPYNI